MMVAVAVLAAVIVLVAQIFKISTEAAGRTSAQAEVISAAAAFREHVSDLLGKIEPGLLIIESPPPTAIRAEVDGGPAVFRLRHDRLVFIASGQAGEFQSFTDPARGTPGSSRSESVAPVSSSQALITIGPGITRADANGPLSQQAFFTEPTIPATEWVLSSRTILLLPTQGGTGGLGGASSFVIPTMQTSTTGQPTFANNGVPAGMLAGGGLVDDFRTVFRDVVTSSIDRADAATFINLVQSVRITDILGPNPPIAALWESNWCPTTSSQLDLNALDYYVRSGWNFQPRLADFRIEWTDGRRVNPNANPPDLRTRWFGLQPSPGSASGGPAGVAYRAGMRGIAGSWPGANCPNPNADNPDNQPIRDPVTGALRPGAETTAFRFQIEWSPDGTAASQINAYRAIWRTDTWQYRPKALRFTFRLFDPSNRLSQTTTIDQDENGQPDPNTNPPAIVERYGQESSIVVPLP